MIAYTLCWFKFSSCFVYQLWPCISCPPHLCVCIGCICTLSRWWRVFLWEFPPSWSSVLETLITTRRWGQDNAQHFLMLQDGLIAWCIVPKKPSVRHSAESLSPWKMASQASDARSLLCAAVLQGMHASKESNYGAKCNLQYSTGAQADKWWPEVIS